MTAVDELFDDSRFDSSIYGSGGSVTRKGAGEYARLSRDDEEWSGVGLKVGASGDSTEGVPGAGAVAARRCGGMLASCVGSTGGDRGALRTGDLPCEGGFEGGPE